LNFRKIDNKQFLSRALYVALSAIALFYVLYVFEGYGIYEGESLSGHSLFVRALLFGLLNGLALGAMEFFIAPKLRLDKIQSRALWRLLQLVVGGTATFILFNFFWQWTDLTGSVYLEILFEYTLVMLIPMILVEFISRIQTVQKETPKLLHFVAENGKDQFQVRAEELLYIKSESNYVEIFYKADAVKSHVLRTTLKRILEDKLLNKTLKQSHRSYLVNAAQVKRVIRDKGKMQIDLGAVQIPISKSFEASFID